jgi:hypothetical protein
MRAARLVGPIPLALAFCGLLLSACSRSGSDSTADVGAAGFYASAVTTRASGELRLNDPIVVRFSKAVDLATRNENSLWIERMGAGDPAPVAGDWGLGADPAEIVFTPRVPSQAPWRDGSFLPDTSYALRLASDPNGPILRDVDGMALAGSAFGSSFSFRTVRGTRFAELVRDVVEGPPRVLEVEARPMVGGVLPLGSHLIGCAEITVRFDQRLDPESLLEAAPWLQLVYDDPELGVDTPVLKSLRWTQLEDDAAELLLLVEGQLPNDALLRLILDPRVRDVSGRMAGSAQGFDPVLARLQTERAREQRFDALVFDFGDPEVLDPEAGGLGPVAEIRNGVLRADGAFAGTGARLDYAPSSIENILNTNRQVIGAEEFVGGVFPLRSLGIKQGVSVRAIGENPLVFLVDGPVQIDGTLSVSGSDGANSSQGHNGSARGCTMVSGGKGGPAAGDGGASLTGITSTIGRGEEGHSSPGFAGGGGQGGRVGCSYHRGSGGGGGTLSTPGDPDFYGQSSPKLDGIGGGEHGGRPGASVFANASEDDDFWGYSLDAQGRRFGGELAAPIGGSGGGGGGNRSGNPYVPSAGTCEGPIVQGDLCGGGGGGGGGVLVIQAMGRIVIGEQGRILADGGYGGGGAMRGSSSSTGGGGGGSGGMVVLMSASGIELHTHGSRYAPEEHWDASFSVSADGGLGINSSFGAPARTVKYVGPSSWNSGSTHSGAYGGMGIVQLHAPTGSDVDGTGTQLDDGIQIVHQNVILSGQAKTDWIFAGDIRPRPKVLPLSFGYRASAETRWVYSGATSRRASMTGPRSTTAKPGQDWRFDAIYAAGDGVGALRFDSATGELIRPRLSVGKRARAAVQSFTLESEWRGRPVTELVLSAASMPGDGSWTGALARVHERQPSTPLDLRIAGHDDRRLWLVGDRELLREPASVEVFSAPVDVRVDGVSGLGSFVEFGTLLRQREPRQNLRLGFAFHRDPSSPRIVERNGQEHDLHRFPTLLGSFVTDLESQGPGSLREQLLDLQLPYARLRVDFDLNYRRSPENHASPRSSDQLPVMELRRVLLPYRY